MRRRTFLTGAAALALAPSAEGAGIRSLRRVMRGKVLTPGHPAYDNARRLFDTRYDIRPPAIAVPIDPADVRAVVRWAADHDAHLVARSSGHAYNAGSSSEHAVVVDLRKLAGIRLEGQQVRVGPSARGIDVYTALSDAGRGFAGGSCPTVAMGGLALGGGMGLAGRRHGLLCDNVAAFDIVTADGRLRHASARRNPDLFWALRGGGGNFGIVTALHLETFAAGATAWFSGSYPRTSADAALATWDALAPSAPRELTSILTLPKGGGRVTVLGQFLGRDTDLRRIAAPLTDVAGASITFGTARYGDLQRRWAGCADGGLPACQAFRPQAFAAASVYVDRRLSAADRHALLDAADGATLLLDAYGGAIRDVGLHESAFVHRHARFSVQILDYAPVAQAVPAVRHAHALLEPVGNGQAYQNYADPSLKHAQRAWYGSNLPQLRRLKRRYDPDNRFRLRQGL